MRVSEARRYSLVFAGLAVWIAGAWEPLLIRAGFIPAEVAGAAAALFVGGVAVKVWREG